jgi:hypothetical protein
MTAEEILDETAYDLGITMSTLSKNIALEAMEEYAKEQCQKRDELIKAQDEMLMLFPPTIYWCDAMDELRNKIEQLKSEL